MVLADFAIGSTASLQFALDSRRALSSLALTTGSKSPTQDIPKALEAARSGGDRRLNVNDARIAVEVALVSGYGIISALETLADAFRLAADQGLTGELTGLTLGGTRISGVNITSQGKRLVKALDNLVKNADVGGANLIQSGSRRFSLQTTQFGGRITVSPQALDSKALGIDDLSGITREEALASVAKINTALTLARARVDGLEVLRDSIAPGSGLSAEISRVVNSSSTSFLPRGSLINQIA